jgi:hypothetical protein
MSDAFFVTRTIPVTDASTAQLEQGLRCLEKIEPVTQASINELRRLKISYDASCIGFKDIERMLDEAGIRRPASMGWRIKAAWYAFLDTNARNAALGGGGACCNKPPGMKSGNPSH